MPPERLRAEDERQTHEDIGDKAGWEGKKGKAARVFVLEGQRSVWRERRQMWHRGKWRFKRYRGNDEVFNFN